MRGGDVRARGLAQGVQREPRLTWQAWPFGDEAAWAARGWRWAEAADTAGPKVYVAPEVHARYHGRGAFGARMVHLLTASLWPGGGTGEAPDA